MDIDKYQQRVEQAKAREQSALDELSQRFNARFEVLQRSEAAVRVRSVLAAKGKLGKRPKAGPIY